MKLKIVIYIYVFCYFAHALTVDPSSEPQDIVLNEHDFEGYKNEVANTIASYILTIEQKSKDEIEADLLKAQEKFIKKTRPSSGCGEQSGLSNQSKLEARVEMHMSNMISEVLEDYDNVFSLKFNDQLEGKGDENGDDETEKLNMASPDDIKENTSIFDIIKIPEYDDKVDEYDERYCLRQIFFRTPLLKKINETLLRQYESRLRDSIYIFLQENKNFVVNDDDESPRASDDIIHDLAKLQISARIVNCFHNTLCPNENISDASCSPVQIFMKRHSTKFLPLFEEEIEAEKNKNANVDMEFAPIVNIHIPQQPIQSYKKYYGFSALAAGTMALISVMHTFYKMKSMERILYDKNSWMNWKNEATRTPGAQSYEGRFTIADLCRSIYMKYSTPQYLDNPEKPLIAFYGDIEHEIQLLKEYLQLAKTIEALNLRTWYGLALSTIALAAEKLQKVEKMKDMFSDYIVQQKMERYGINQSKTN